MKASGATAISKLPCALYPVAVPIGNLGDITLRALTVLQQADLVLCEDTRVTGGLLHHYGIKQKLLAYHDHNAAARQPEILQRLAAGEAIALVSDAGTPLISDPGCMLVQQCRVAGYDVVAVPGASALLTALTSGGLPTNQFFFAGFLPPKQQARRNKLAELQIIPATLIFYEAAPRLAASLADMAKTLGPTRPAIIARELTKLYETIQRDTLENLAARYKAESTKGEIVIMVGAPEAETAPATHDIDKLLKQELKTHTLRDAVASISSATGMKKSEVYKRALMVGKKS